MKRSTSASALLSALVLALLCASSLHAQLTQKWVKTLDGPAHNADQANAIVADSNDNSYVTGSICLTLTTTTPANCATSALLVVKYDKAGNVVWQDQFTGPGTSWPTAGTAIALDSRGNVYVTGYGDSGQAVPNATATASELLTIKYSPSGQRLWLATRVLPPSSFDAMFRKEGFVTTRPLRKSR